MRKFVFVCSRPFIVKRGAVILRDDGFVCITKLKAAAGERIVAAGCKPSNSRGEGLLG